MQDASGTDVTPFSREGSPRPPVLRAAVVTFLGCTALGGISCLDLRFVSVAHGSPIPWSFLVLTTLPRWLVLGATLPVILHIGVGGQGRRNGGRLAALHVLTILGISWMQAAVTSWTYTLSSPEIAALFPLRVRLLRAWYSGLPTALTLYAALLLAAWALAESMERQHRTVVASRLEAQLRSAQLAALRAQLQPHFLYNTLTGIAALVAALEPQRAVSAIEQLSELLHASLHDNGRTDISLSEEIALAERYLALQRMRFEDRLSYHLSVAPDVASFTVPSLLLQPVIENAVVHGLDAGVASMHVDVTAVRTGGTVTLRVSNNGVSPSDSAPAPQQGGGVGLAVTRARLTTRYGSDASLTLTARDGGGAVVLIAVPA